MKVFLKFSEIIFVCIIAIWQVAEILAVPALFVIIGIWNDFPWQYYVFSVGGYFLLFALIDIICRFIFRVFEKKYTPIFERMLYNIVGRFSAKSDDNV